MVIPSNKTGRVGRVVRNVTGGRANRQLRRSPAADSTTTAASSGRLKHNPPKRQLYALNHTGATRGEEVGQTIIRTISKLCIGGATQRRDRADPRTDGRSGLALIASSFPSLTDHDSGVPENYLPHLGMPVDWETARVNRALVSTG